jgi:hypothetical protein
MGGAIRVPIDKRKKNQFSLLQYFLFAKNEGLFSTKRPLQHLLFINLPKPI